MMHEMWVKMTSLGGMLTDSLRRIYKPCLMICSHVIPELMTDLKLNWNHSTMKYMSFDLIFLVRWKVVTSCICIPSNINVRILIPKIWQSTRTRMRTWMPRVSNSPPLLRRGELKSTRPLSNGYIIFFGSTWTYGFTSLVLAHAEVPEIILKSESSPKSLHKEVGKQLSMKNLKKKSTSSNSYFLL